LTLYCFSYCGGVRRAVCRGTWGTNCLQCLGHDLGAVVDGQHHVGDASRRQRLDLVLDHGLVGKLDKRLGVCERLQRALVGHAIVAGSTAGLAVSKQDTYKRAQTGSKPSDENNGYVEC